MNIVEPSISIGTSKECPKKKACTAQHVGTHLDLIDINLKKPDRSGRMPSNVV